MARESQAIQWGKHRIPQRVNKRPGWERDQLSFHRWAPSRNTTHTERGCVHFTLAFFFFSFQNFPRCACMLLFPGKIQRIQVFLLLFFIVVARKKHNMQSTIVHISECPVQQLSLLALRDLKHIHICLHLVGSKGPDLTVASFMVPQNYGALSPSKLCFTKMAPYATPAQDPT